MRKLLLSATIVLLILNSRGQDKSPVKFGKISAEDFKNSVYSIDSNAAAVVIADIGYSYYEGNERGWFTFFHERHRRIHVLKNNGYDAADVEIPIYVSGGIQEELQSFKASTYNLENGSVKEAKVDNKGLFTDKLDKNHIVKKFTFPNVKEGSIIEFSYTIRSDFWNSPTNWYFQGKYPVLWSELEFHIPEFFYFVFITEGYNEFHIKQPPVASTKYFDVTLENLEAGRAMQRERKKIEAEVFRHRWVIKNAPGIKAERFTSSVINHISKIEFQLSEIRPPLSYRAMMLTWPMLTEKLLMSEYFGAQLDNANNWMDDELKGITTAKSIESEKAKKIYEYIRDHFSCIDHSARYMDQPLRNVMRSKKGNVAEINLLLVAMLKNAGIHADPLLLSTKSHGYTYSMYPLEEKFNYVVAVAEIGGKKIYMDATHPKLGFGVLPYECYNGFACTVDKNATAVTLNPDSLTEKKISTVLITNKGKGVMSGAFRQVPGVYESYELRTQLAEKGPEPVFADFRKAFNNVEAELGYKGIDSIQQLDEQLSIHFDFDFLAGDGDIIYFNPMVVEGYKENPFKSATRDYPVEMPYAIDETYVFRMEAPDGYGVDELPKSIRINFDEEGTSFFEYIIASNNGVISLRSRVKLLRTYYVPGEYEILREFFSQIVTKHNEEIVFKKKK